MTETIIRHRTLSAVDTALITTLYGRYNARWRVLVNLSEDDLLNWRET